MMRKIKKLYPLFNVIKLFKIARPLGARHAFSFYTAPLRWIPYLGRVRYYDLLQSHLLLDTQYGMFYTHGSNIGLLFQETYEVERVLPELVNRDTIFVDVGAYLGFYTVWACRRSRRVLAIEPNPMALAYLKVNAMLNKCSNVTIIPKAVSDTRSLVKLRIPRPARKGHILTTASIVWNFEDALEVNVEADTLDNMVEEVGLDTVDFIKIDVEGAEGLVVRGAEKTLRKARALLIEIWPENMWVTGKLQNLGYKLVKVIKRKPYTNYLFLR